MFTRPVRKTLVLNTICTVCITQTVYYISLLCVKYGMYAYAGRAYICRMYAPSMLFPPTQPLGKIYTNLPVKSNGTKLGFKAVRRCMCTCSPAFESSHQLSSNHRICAILFLKKYAGIER